MAKIFISLFCGMITENEIARVVMDICFKIHKKYGPGLFESVYEEIFCYELTKIKLSFTRQQAIPLVHDELKWELDLGLM